MLALLQAELWNHRFFGDSGQEDAGSHFDMGNVGLKFIDKKEMKIEN